MFQSRCHTLRGTLCALPLLWSMLSVWHLQPHYLGQLSLIPLCLGCNLWGTHNLSKCFVSSWKTLVYRLKCLRATVSAEEVHFRNAGRLTGGNHNAIGAVVVWCISPVSRNSPLFQSYLYAKICPGLASVVMFTYTFLCGTRISGSSHGLNLHYAPSTHYLTTSTWLGFGGVFRLLLLWLLVYGYMNMIN